MAINRQILYLVIIYCYLFSGCGKAQTKMIDDKTEIKLEKSEFQIEAASSVKPEECYICGEREESLMPYYAKRDSIGIIHWNQLEIIDSDVRAYDDDGNELFGQNGCSMSSCSFGDGYGSVYVSGTPNRGFTNVKVYYKDKDELDFSAVSKIVCQKCLDKAAEFYTDQKNAGKDSRIATTGYCLVDFTTSEIYTLSDPYRGYFIRDYYVTYDIKESIEGTENRIEILIIYAPERERENR